MYTVVPDPQRLGAFLEADEPDGPLVMLNLLRFRERAEYPADVDAEPCSGREAYQQRYGPAAFEHVRAAGGRVLWMGSAWFGLIAPADETWDEVVLVEYPSRAAFLEMIAKPAYQAAAVHRTAALLDSRLVATTAVAQELEPAS